MTRARRIAWTVGGVIVGPLLIGLVVGLVIVQTDWFRNTVRSKIVSTVEEATGGRAEVGSFAFDWRRMRVLVRNFVLHGLEPAGAPPLFRANLLQVDLKLTSPFQGAVNIAYLLADSPQANVIIYPDGRTNIPAPKLRKPSDKSGLETVVDLAIGKFDLRKGSLAFGERKSDFSARGGNLRAQLDYSALKQSYSGEIALSPLLLQTGANPPLLVDVTLPVSLEKDRITLANAKLNTPGSEVLVSGTLEHLVDPRFSARVNARIALEEVKRAAGLDMNLDTASGPAVLNAEIDAAVDENNRVNVKSARVTLGGSSLEASGTPESIDFRSTLALGELGRLLRAASLPAETVTLGGNAAVAENRIDLKQLRVVALGGSFEGSGALDRMERFRLAGDLRGFDIDRLLRLGYSGVISGPVQVEGNLKNTSDLVARAGLSIAPGRRGVPVSGRLNVDYNGRAETAALARSYLKLPHTRVDLAGSLGQQIQVRAVSRDLRDFQPLGAIPVQLNGGIATVNATVAGSLGAPRVTAQAHVTSFAVQGRPFSRFTANLSASKTGATLSNAVLSRGNLQASISGKVGLRNWKLLQTEPLRADVNVRNADLADILALAGSAPVKATGILTADARIAGTVGSPTGTATFAVANGTLEGERFDSLAGRAVMTPEAIDVPGLQFVAGPSRIDATANYRHPLNDLGRGILRAHVASNQVQLAQFQTLLKNRPGLRGVLALNGDAAAEIRKGANGTEVIPSNIAGNLSVRGLEMEGRRLGDLTATVNTAAGAARYNVVSDFAGASIEVDGRSMLTGNHETTAGARIVNLPIERVLEVAGRRDLPVSGLLSASAQVSGTTADPRVNATLNISKGMAWQEPVDRLEATVGYSNQLVDVPSLRLDSGSARVELAGAFTHPVGDFGQGQVKFRVGSNQVQLSGLRTLQKEQPGLGGVVEVSADGAATLRRNQAPLFSTLNARLAARNLSLRQKPLGSLNATAETRASEVVFQLTSDLASSRIQGSGRMELAGDYPVTANVTFANLTYAGLAPLFQSAAQPFDASAEGQVTLSGMLNRTDSLRGSLRINRLEARSAPTASGRKPRVAFELRNDGPIVASLDRSIVTIQSARIAGPMANLNLTGTASLTEPRTMNVRAGGSVKLDILEALNTDIFSSGTVVLNAAVTGTTSKPVVNGRLEVQNASLNMVSVPNGLSNANGTVLFNGTEAVIQNLTGETGGGKLRLAGTVAYGGPEMRLRLEAAADRVRYTHRETVTAEVDARLNLTGTTSRNVLSGGVTIRGVAMHSQTDIGNILTSAAKPPSAETAQTGLLGGMRFDVKIQTAPDVQIRSDLTRNLQADANLTLSGSPTHPGMIGRVIVTAGEVVFFGSRYGIDRGVVSFYNPQRIMPTANLDLETTVQGIDVAISVSGRMDRLKLSYRSDPPMLFSDLVSLLASGKVPTTDPVLAARQPVGPQQSFQQLGASTVLGQAVANPVSGRLQRLFGVSRLKIDPQITGASNTALATLTLQQQITNDLTFTYIQDVTQSNPQIIRIEWTIDPRLSAIAQRDSNGVFDLDFFYKRRFW